VDGNWKLKTIAGATNQPTFEDSTKAEPFANESPQIVFGKAIADGLSNVSLDMTK
jgi:hypothetical protein